jgi:hypothetical protein
MKSGSQRTGNFQVRGLLSEAVLHGLSQDLCMTFKDKVKTAHDYCIQSM